MAKEEVKIELSEVDVPYKKIHKDLYLTVNGKEVWVYVTILQDAGNCEYELDNDISERDAEHLTEEEYEAVKEWCDDQDMEGIGSDQPVESVHGN